MVMPCGVSFVRVGAASAFFCSLPISGRLEITNEKQQPSFWLFRAPRLIELRIHSLVLFPYQMGARYPVCFFSDVYKSPHTLSKLNKNSSLGLLLSIARKYYISTFPPSTRTLLYVTSSQRFLLISGVRSIYRGSPVLRKTPVLRFTSRLIEHACRVSKNRFTKNRG